MPIPVVLADVPTSRPPTGLRTQQSPDSYVFVLLTAVQKKRVIVSVTNDLFTDNRVRKVCEFLYKNGFDITLVGRKLRTSLDLPPLPYKTKRFRLLFTKGALFYACYNLRLFFYLLFRKADILVANDLDTLLANSWARKFKRNCRLVYDSHEYFTGVPELVERPAVQRFWKRIEKRTVPKVDVMYTVNESIAYLYKKEYRREVLVVRNIADVKLPANLKSKAELGLPEDKRIVILQGAGINIQRGAEELTEAMQWVENSVLIIVGGGDVIDELKAKVEKNGWQKKVLFFGKRSYAELMNFSAVSDIGVSLDKDTNINYRFSLPNKIFDYIHAGIPVLVSDLPEIRKIVAGYEVGVICPSHDPKIIASALNGLFAAPGLYAQLKHNTKRAAAELTWEKECKVLEKIYL
jgi:glycosyltransferase involved in cell wall biosynthesis